MQVVECRKIDSKKYDLIENDNIYFLRIDPEDLSIALQDILNELGNFSWLAKFDKDFLRESMKTNAEKTCDALKKKFYDKNGNPIVQEAGEYVVSVFAKRGIVEKLNHADVPLAELLGRKITNNPGFDFFTEESNLNLITCGEAKYLHGKNAYGTSLSQINDFIKNKKHISDIVILNGLVSDDSLRNLNEGRFGICSAFSSTDMDSATLIENICSNANFKKASSYEYIVLVAVNVL